MDAANTLTLSGNAGLGRTGSTVQFVGTGTLIIDTSAAGTTAYGALLRGSATLQINNVVNALGTTTMSMGDSTFGLTGTTSPTVALNGATLTNSIVLENVTTNRIISNIAAGASSTMSGNLIFNKNTDLTLSSKTADGKLVVSGTIADSTFAGAVKVGSSFYANAGTVELSRATGNDYDGGTTVNSGTLLVSNTSGSATGTGAVTVNTGGRLIGSGRISGDVLVNSGGSISGGATVGVLNTGNLSLASGSALEVQINSLTAGTGYDQISVTGSVTLGGDLAITLDFVPVQDSLFFLLLNDGTDAITGVLGGHAQGDTFAMAGYNWRISYLGDSATNSFTGGNDVVVQSLSAIPEPSTYALVGLAAVAGVYGLRCKAKLAKA
jgi:autotransporter-associated beta strand protein